MRYNKDKEGTVSRRLALNVKLQVVTARLGVGAVTSCYLPEKPG
jgi:hypothetical protein